MRMEKDTVLFTLKQTMVTKSGELVLDQLKILSTM